MMTLREFFALPKSFTFVSGEPYRDGIKTFKITFGDFMEYVDFYSYPVISGGYMDTFDNYEEMGMITCSKSFFYSFSSVLGVFLYDGGLFYIRLYAYSSDDFVITVCGATILNDDICFDYEQLDLLGLLDKVYVEVFHDVFNYSVQYTFGASARYKWKPEYPCYYSSQMGSANIDLDSPSGFNMDIGYKRRDRLGFNLSVCCELDFTKLGVLLGTES